MVFSSILFIFQFLPVALIVYYAIPKKFKNAWLMAVSLVFYSWGELRFLPLMLTTILVNYFAALAMERYDKQENIRKLLIAAAALISLGFLFVFKYFNFFWVQIGALFSLNLAPLDGLTLPLGISFYTFQTLSYTIDVYRRKVPAEHNIIDTAAFVTLFPQLIAGPIVRYTDIAAELKSRKITREKLDSGMEDFILGLARKVLIANNIGALWTEAENLGFSSLSTGMAWLSLLAFTLQIYFDFSGYSQMAIGLGKMMGFEFPQNFDVPYTARSITEFWRRWHMTLGSWFREYVYFPLGGSRKGYWRTVLNLFIVWALTGLWHGASWNFVLWGLYFFVLLWIEKSGLLKFLDKHPAFSHLYALFFIVLGWALFAITDFTQLGVFLQRLFVPMFAGKIAPVGMIYYLRNYLAVMLVGGFCASQTAGNLYKRLREHTLVRNILLVVLFLLAVAYLVDATYNPFLYFRF